MSTLEKVSSLEDMKKLIVELNRVKIKFLYDFYAVLQDYSSKKILPQWLQKKNINEVLIKEYGYEILGRIIASKRRCILIYDLETPDLNGLQLLAALDKDQEAKSRCGVILSAPRLAPAAQDKLLHLGAKAIISKPIVESELKLAFMKFGLDY